MDKLRLDLDFSKDPIAQDMICRIMRDKGFQTPQNHSLQNENSLSCIISIQYPNSGTENTYRR